MIHRTYVVLMPTSGPTTPLDIVVMGNPGTAAAPIKTSNSPVGWSGSDGAYYEWRGRPLRIPVLATGSGGGAANGFVPRLKLGFLVTITPIKAAIVTDQPGVQLSASLASLASTDSGPTINIPALADPTYGPVIRLVGGANTAGTFWLVHLLVMDQRDEDRDPTGN